MTRPRNVIELRNHINDMSRFTTNELFTELCNREGVVEYLHGENSHFDILKMNDGVGGALGDNKYMMGYKTIPKTSRVLVIDI